MAGFPVQQPDPNNPGQTRWVDSETGQPVAAPGTGPNANTIVPTGATQSTATPATSTAPATTAAVSTAQPAPTVAPDVTPVTPTGPPGPDGKPTYTLDNIIEQNQLEINQAYLQATDAAAKANDAMQRQRDYEAGKGGPDHTQGTLNPDNPTQPNPAYTSAVSDVTNFTNQAISAQTRIASAQTARANTLSTAIQNQALQPDIKAKYEADADNATAQAKLAQANADKITAAAPDERALLVAQAQQQTAQSALENAQAAKETATTQDQKNLLDAQAALYQNQAKTADAQVGLIQAQAGLAGAQATLTAGATTDETQARAALDRASAKESDSRTALAQAQIAAGLPQAQAAQAQGAGAQAQATAQSTLEAIRQKQLGPAYGLQQQIDAITPIVNQIASRVWGPGGSGDAGDANDLLKQYVTATLGGTTIADAAKTLAGQQSINYGTQMAGANALQAAQAQRANAYASFGGSALGTLEQMNMYAPKGSTAMGDAFQGLMNAMAQRIAPQGFAPTPIPQPPAYPAFLQAFAAGHQAGTQQAQASGGGGQAAPTVNINVGGQPGGATPMPYTGGAGPGAIQPIPNQPAGQGPPPLVPMSQAPAAGVTAAPTGMNVGAMPGAVNGAQSSPAQTPQQAFDQAYQANAPSMPSYLQGLVNPLSMIQTARNAGLLGGNGGLLTPGLPGSFTY